jgi:lipoprotein NlpD
MITRALIVISLSLMLAACGGSTKWYEDPDTHIVRKGETLYSIAFRYGKSPADVARWNRLGSGSLIYPGQVLRLTPPARKPLPTIPSQPSPQWGWPTSGRINVEFGAKPGPGTGVLINGKAGQPIVAAAPGRVVYAGSGLIGYGQLIILKHNETYLSAYGYTSSLLVKEGQEVKKGQRIATMGEGPERKPRLHFEIRRNGQPIDPRQFLPSK